MTRDELAALNKATADLFNVGRALDQLAADGDEPELIEASGHLRLAAAATLRRLARWRPALRLPGDPA